MCDPASKLNARFTLVGRIWVGAGALLLGVAYLLAWQESPILGQRLIRHDLTGPKRFTNGVTFGYDVNASFAAGVSLYNANVPFTAFQQLRRGNDMNYIEATGVQRAFGTNLANSGITWRPWSSGPKASPVVSSHGLYGNYSVSTAGAAHWPTGLTRTFTSSDVVVPVYLKPLNGYDWRRLTCHPLGNDSVAYSVWLYFEPWEGFPLVGLGYSSLSPSNTYNGLSAGWKGEWAYFVCPFPDYDLGQAAVLARYSVNPTNPPGAPFTLDVRYYSAPGEVVASCEHHWFISNRYAVTFVVNSNAP